MNRRDFVHQSAMTGSLAWMNIPDMMKNKVKQISLQLYSVRDAMTPDPVGTLHQIAEMGYAQVEGHVYDKGKFYTYSPKEFRSILQDAGLKMTSAHTAIHFDHWDESTKKLNDLAFKTIEDHAALGVKQLVCPYISEELRTVGALKKWSELFNQYGEACKREGMTFAYHNHDFEFQILEGTHILDYILGQTEADLVFWEPDLYWIRYALQDPVIWIRQYPHRIHAYHVKDLANSAKRESIEIGNGVIDFKSVFQQPESDDVKYYIVELEHYVTSSMQGVKVCYDHLRKILSEV